jgi:hypothetical protein
MANLSASRDLPFADSRQLICRSKDGDTAAQNTSGHLGPLTTCVYTLLFQSCDEVELSGRSQAGSVLVTADSSSGQSLHHFMATRTTYSSGQD